jgi:spermidine/putrescine transport system permease protein
MVPGNRDRRGLMIVFSMIKVATGYSRASGYLILAHAVSAFPSPIMPIRARLEGMDLTLENAAADLYARRSRSSDTSRCRS